ncbi:hypothetical protein [Salidesulfovibrio onnuriiensis]|uniref:hypothetical protein n=1 Tax=Salidesulfovibrio onnuriiensis TaxID=2583823 RepID=UPI0011C73CC5|nr:hypothetical protein [Salidesulfovibrio onnuriiensis]
MKKLTVLLAAFVFAAAFAGSGFAQEGFTPRGSAVVPGILVRHGNDNWLNMNILLITNISASDVTCRVTVYDENGNDVSNLCSVSTGAPGSSVETIAQGTGTFALPPASTRMVYVYRSDMKRAIMGHAVIAWDSENDKLRKALMAVHRMRTDAGNRGHTGAIAVNGGQAF